MSVDLACVQAELQSAREQLGAQKTTGAPHLPLQTNIRLQENFKIHVLWVSNVSKLHSTPNNMPTCRCHWYVEDAHEASRAFGLEDVSMALDFFAFVVIPLDAALEGRSTLTLTSNTDGTHLGAHFESLKDFCDSEKFCSRTLLLMNKHGSFAEATIFAAVQTRWVEHDSDENPHGVHFVDPCNDAQARYILQHIGRTSCQKGDLILPPVMTNEGP
eukprot:gnl/MRDRNA2_/MRDRNA2_43658_c0_seq1.p1 gnl/MRDRNA2_/MRDRNA2_43658_c0~~gnl/MRDRNA2_/MRDRNA2_43658_c0_seq1.p1  ORF type:complete len:216 (+),score=37.49 gnl/MRDRNA2_/MRDRNA2_43658_c0_seq1:332-979(+)